MRVLILAVGTLAAVVAIVLAIRGDDSDEERSGGASEVAGISVEDVAERVERLRGLEFKEDPHVQVADEEDITDLLRDIDRALVREDPDQVERVERTGAAIDALLALGGVIERADIAKLERGAGDDIGLGGMYQPERRQIFLAREAVREGGRQAETVLAHELTHLLEDQHFPGFETRLEPFSDRVMANQALREGTAEFADARYAAEHLGAGPVPDLLARRRERISAAKVPDALVPVLLFPYEEGARFARALAGGAPGWELIDRAHRRPPETTEQVLHPEAWARGEGSTRPQLNVEGALNRGWKLLGSADLGEVHTVMLLRAGVEASHARGAAAGWDGGGFEVWYRGRLPSVGCPASCRRTTAAALAWNWDDRREAREFDAAVRRYLQRALDARPAGPSSWTVRAGGAAALVARSRSTVLALAPSVRVAEEIARRSATGG